MKRVRIFAMMLVWAALAVAQADALPAGPPLLELEKFTLHHTFDVTITRKRQRIQSATVNAVSQKLDRAGLRVGDELLRINGKAIKGLKVADFERRLQNAEGLMVYTFSRKDPGSGKLRTLDLTLTPEAQAPSNAPE